MKSWVGPSANENCLSLFAQWPTAATPSLKENAKLQLSTSKLDNNFFIHLFAYFLSPSWTCHSLSRDPQTSFSYRMPTPAAPSWHRSYSLSRGPCVCPRVLLWRLSYEALPLGDVWTDRWSDVQLNWLPPNLKGMTKPLTIVLRGNESLFKNKLFRTIFITSFLWSLLSVISEGCVVNQPENWQLHLFACLSVC